MKKQKITMVQVLTIAFIVLYIVWERNLQLYLSENNLENTYASRRDLTVIIPVLLTLIFISVRQWLKRHDD